MSYKLIIFPNPLDSICTFKHDTSGVTLLGKGDVHPSGRLGQSFEFPIGIPNQNGGRLVISKKGKVDLVQRGILYLNDGILQYPWLPEQTAAFSADDFTLQDVVIIKVPAPTSPPPVILDNPFEIIKDVYKFGNFNLSTHDGCGQFTEACCKSLHELHSNQWGHIKKVGAQEQYNHHAIDAIMLLTDVTDTKSGIYDIIKNSQVPSAEPSFNRVDNTHPELWYYPA